MTRFFLIRHALIDGCGTHLNGRAAGVHLNAQGRVQADALAHHFSTTSLAAVYSSPLERGLETAEAIARGHGLNVSACDEFLEIEFGSWTGKPVSLMAGDPHFQRFNTFRSCTCVPDGESMLQAQVRMILGLDRLRARYPAHQVAVVSHGDMIKAAIAFYAGIHFDLFQRIEISPGSVSVVDLGEDTVRILGINDTSAAGNTS